MITVNDQPRQWQAGLTVARLLDAMEDGDIYAVVRLNGRLVSRPHFAETPIDDGAVVQLLPMIAGG